MIATKYYLSRCDGTTITAPSPWAGEMTPNINGEGRFLRGGSDGDLLKREEDSLQQHTHGVSDPGHSHEVSDSGHTHRYNDKHEGLNDGVDDVHWGPSEGDKYHDRWDVSHYRSTTNAKSNIRVNSAKTNIRVTNVSGARTSGETRPKNIRVVYIMKVF